MKRIFVFIAMAGIIALGLACIESDPTTGGLDEFISDWIGVGLIGVSVYLSIWVMKEE